MGRIVAISTAMHDSRHWMNSHAFPGREKDIFAEMELGTHGRQDGETLGEKHTEGVRRYAIIKCSLVMFMFASPSHCSILMC
jgi:hypothetical protein